MILPITKTLKSKEEKKELKLKLKCLNWNLELLFISSFLTFFIPLRFVNLFLSIVPIFLIDGGHRHIHQYIFLTNQK